MINNLKQIFTFLDKSSDAAAIAGVLSEVFPLNAIYIYDSTTDSLRDFSKSWMFIKSGELNTVYKELENQKYFKGKNKSYYGLYNNGKIIGMLEFSEHLYKELLNFLELIDFTVSLKIQNVILSARMQKNIEFHDSMKNIAKILETQYEINYIVPIIGEMIDKFVSDHLVYIFINNELVWPSACNDTKIFELIKLLNNKSEYILTPDKRIGLFPLISEGKLLGCIVTKSTENVLSQKEIEYIEQLSSQAATTINRANVYAEILKHATLDALTGFYNRRQLEERIKQEVSSAKRQKRNLCAIMTDIDYFKSVNDTYGHAVGDLVLKTVSKVIRNQLREYDIAGRYGGEEFVILLPYTRIEEAKMVAERLRCAVEAKKIDISKLYQDKENISVTISIGVAPYQAAKDDNEFVRNADKALYEAKESGRNKVVTYI